MMFWRKIWWISIIGMGISAVSFVLSWILESSLQLDVLILGILFFIIYVGVKK